MGTTLTGLTPATTYDALIKVTDNGPLSATAKYLSDGLGNDSILALSSNKVGIGTFAPSQPLHVNGNMRLNGALYDNNNLAGTSGQILSSTGTATNWIDVSSLGVVDGSGTANYVSKWSDPNTLTNSLIYDNGTNVGIGTANPSYKLDVSGSARVNSTSNLAMFVKTNSAFGAAISYEDSTTGGNDVISAGAIGSDFYISTNFSERMRITASGNVGIGNSTPDSYKGIATTKVLAVGSTVGNNGVNVISGATSTGSYSFSDSGGNDRGGLTYFHTADLLTVQTAGSEKMRITSTGNVGIGTSSPADLLHLDGKSNYPFIRFAASQQTTARYFKIGMTDAVTHTIEAFGPSTLMNFLTSGSERMRITSTGNVGIGTSSPTEKLQVAGNILIDKGDNGYLSIKNGAQEVAALGDFGGGTDGQLLLYNNAGSLAVSINGEANSYINSGNVGIGTSAPSGKLQINTSSSGAATIGAFLTNENNALNTEVRLAFAANTNIDSSTNRYSYISALNTSGSNGQDLVFATNTAGNAATEKMRITAAGNVGIGTTSPAYKLEVNGNAYCTDLSLPAAGGIYFDNAASKYLDDYEVGTWTMGITFGGASTGITYTTNTGTYTKIGRQVTVNGLIQLSNKGSSTGGVRITGLPFNVANTNGNYSQSSLRVKNISFLNAYQGYAEINTTTIVLEQVTNLGVVTAITDTDFANNSEIIISLTYFV